MKHDPNKTNTPAPGCNALETEVPAARKPLDTAGSVTSKGSGGGGGGCCGTVRCCCGPAPQKTIETNNPHIRDRQRQHEGRLS